MVKYEGGVAMYIMSPNIKVNQQQNNFNEDDYVYAIIPDGQELLDLLNRLGLNQKKHSDDYIISPEEPYRESMEKYCSKCFSFFFSKLNRDYDNEVQFKHLRQTYVTAEDLFLRRGFSMQHSKYRTTAKHYVDRKETAKDMVANGFRVFPPGEKRTLR